MKIYLGTIFCYKLKVILLLVRYRYSPGTSLFMRVADPCSYFTNPDPEFPKNLIRILRTPDLSENFLIMYTVFYCFNLYSEHRGWAGGGRLAALVNPVQNIICLTAHFFTFIVPIAQQPGQVVVLDRLSL
jgi:hypothetical protein